MAQKIMLFICVLAITSCQLIVPRETNVDLNNVFLEKYRGKEVLNIAKMKGCIIVFFTDGTQLTIDTHK